MCGILVQYSKEGTIDENRFKDSLYLQRQRGPDNQSYVRFGPNLIMGHTRLSIIDLNSDSNQPFKSSNGNYISFNGEIYNFLEIREELEKQGKNFSTTGDTEVLVSHLDESYTEKLSQLNGMWSFAYYLVNENKLLISRDRFGKKPLYYYEDEFDLIISSEIKSIYSLKSIERKVNKKHLLYFLNTNLWHQEDNSTFYEDIKKVMPGQSIQFDLSNNTKDILKTHSLEDHISNNKDIEELEVLLSDSVEKRLISDVPVGMFLSGGVDSSVVASIANFKDPNLIHLTSQTTDQDNYYSKLLAEEKDLDLQEVDLNEEAIVDTLKDMTKYFELPIPVYGISLGMNQMFKEAHFRDLKVVLDGTGGDEIFGGYHDFYGPSLLEGYIRRGNFLGLLSFIYYSFISKYNALSAFKTLLNRFLARIFGHNDFLDDNSSYDLVNPFFLKKRKMFLPRNISDLLSMQQFDVTRGRLQTWLQLNDLNSMMYSIETRNPLLDYRLLDYLGMKEKYKFSKGYNKFLLRQLLSRLTSVNIAWRRDKKGMTFSFSNLVEKHRQMFLCAVKKSTLIKTLVSKTNPETFLDDFFLNDTEEKDLLLLRCYAVSLLEIEYNLKI